MARPGEEVPLILMNDAALALPPDLTGPVAGARLVVAGASRVRLALATLAQPEATTIWTDFRHSASLVALGARVRRMGRLDRLILAGDGGDSGQMFAIMRTIVTILPSLRRGRDRGIVLVATDGPALPSLQEFLRRLRPDCDRRGIGLDLRVVEPDGSGDPVAAAEGRVTLH